MKIKTLFLTLSLIFVLGTALDAQDYKTAVGGKLGYGLIGSYKTFLNEKAAIDAFAGLRWGGLAAGVYYLNHTPIESVERLQWYWGAGPILTTWNNLSGESYSRLGLSGVIGLDYSIEDLTGDKVPLNFSIEYAPTLVIYNSSIGGNNLGFLGGFGVVSVRYILN
jgi:hypothetical protein